MRNLIKLCLDDNQLTEDAALSLAGSQYLTQVKELSLNYNEIGKVGLASIANSETFACLTHIYVEQNNIEAEGLHALAMSPYMSNLIHLNIKSNAIESEGLHGLAIGNIKRLRYLNVQHNDIGEDGFRVISDSENFQRLVELKIFDGNPGTTSESKNILKRAHNL